MSTAVSTNESTKSRQQISALVELSLSTARTRRHIDPLGLNSSVQKGIDECNESLRVIEKEGGPENPGAAPKEPKKLKADASDEEASSYTESMAAYTKAKEEWMVNNQAWKDYSSGKYTELEKVHNCYKLLSKLSNNLLKKKPSKRIQDEVLALQLQLADKPKAQATDETADAYKNRVSQFNAPGYTNLCKGVDLKNPDLETPALSARAPSPQDHYQSNADSASNLDLGSEKGSTAVSRDDASKSDLRSRINNVADRARHLAEVRQLATSYRTNSTDANKEFKDRVKTTGIDPGPVLWGLINKSSEENAKTGEVIKGAGETTKALTGGFKDITKAFLPGKKEGEKKGDQKKVAGAAKKSCYLHYKNFKKAHGMITW